MSRYLETAAAIGRRLVEDAIWHGGRCNWIGAAAEEDRGNPPRPTWAALGSDLYGGTAGVGLALAELSRATGDPGMRRSATGAVRQSISRAEVPSSPPAGLYAGALGVALAAAVVAELLDEPWLADAGRALLRGSERGAMRPDGFDVVAGRAGAILALLALARAFDDGRLTDRAWDVGRELIDAAQGRGDELSWATDGATTALTGLAHGASGAGLALAELAAATGDADLRIAALSAFAYERRLFDPVAGNWPDLRAAAANGASRAFATGWCHGAPGIALARLRVAELWSDELMRSEARLALDATLKAIGASLAATGAGFSICHGLAGNAEVVRIGSAHLGSSWPEGERASAEVADLGIEAYARPRQAWPCGVPDGETPGLMLGLSGIALFYLRMHDQAVTSPVMPTLGLRARCLPS